MKRILFVLSLFFASLWLATAEVSAQTFKFGYLSYTEVLRQMPEYAAAQQSLADLKVKYEKEATRGEEEFQRKFSEFLQGQKDFPENILVKRQAELQTLMEAGISFRQEAKQLLTKAETDLLAVARTLLEGAIAAVGNDGGYAYVLNTDGHACPFINPLMGEDVTKPVLRKLGLLEEEPAPAVEPAPAEESVPATENSEEPTTETLEAAE